MDKIIDFESVDTGTPPKGMSFPAVNRVTLARFAGAMDDYNPMHLDDRVAVAGGKASVFAPGNLTMAYVGRMVEAWLEGCSLRRFGMRMMRLVWPGDVLTCRGVVVDKRKENGECVVDMDVWADNQRGETVAKGRVLAVVPRTAKHGLTSTEASVGVVYRSAPAGAASRVASAARSKKKSVETAAVSKTKAKTDSAKKTVAKKTAKAKG